MGARGNPETLAKARAIQQANPNPRFVNWRGQVTPSLRFNDEAKQLFLAHYAKNGRMRHAAEAADTSVSTVERHLKDDPDFAEAFAEAKAAYRDHIMGTVYEFAVNGKEDPIVNKDGEIVGHKTTYFPRLLELEAKRVEPQYREGGGNNVSVNVNSGVLVAPVPSDKDEWLAQYGITGPKDVTPSSE